MGEAKPKCKLMRTRPVPAVDGMSGMVYDILRRQLYEVEVECDWEFNPMHGMEECNQCGAMRW